MGMSTHVIGIKPPDARWSAMRSIYQTCEEAGVEVPWEVLDFFNGVKFECIEPTGVVVDVPNKEYEGSDQSGLEIVVADIPDGVKVLRFYNSW